MNYPLFILALVLFFGMFVIAPVVGGIIARKRARGVARSMINHPAGKGR